MGAQSMTLIEQIKNLTLQEGASLATVIAIFLLVWQMVLAKRALKAQKVATESSMYSDLNIEFLNIIKDFSSNINSGMSIDELDEDEKERTSRALARYFYLAHTEFNLIKSDVIRCSAFKDHWEDAIISSAHKKLFVTYWHVNARKFQFSDAFKKFYDEAISKKEPKPTIKVKPWYYICK